METRFIPETSKLNKADLRDQANHIKRLTQTKKQLTVLTEFLHQSFSALSLASQQVLYVMAHEFYQYQPVLHEAEHPFNQALPEKLILSPKLLASYERYLTPLLTPSVTLDIWLTTFRQLEAQYSVLLAHVASISVQKNLWRTEQASYREKFLGYLRQRLGMAIQHCSVDKRNHFWRAYLMTVNQYLTEWGNSFRAGNARIAFYTLPQDNFVIEDFNYMDFKNLDLTRVDFIDPTNEHIIYAKALDLTHADFTQAIFTTEQLIFCKGFSTLRGLSGEQLLALQTLKYQQLNKTLNHYELSTLAKTEEILDQLSRLWPAVKDDHLDWVIDLPNDLKPLCIQLLFTQANLNPDERLMDAYGEIVKQEKHLQLPDAAWQQDFQKLLWRRGGRLAKINFLQILPSFVDYSLQKELDSNEVANVKDWLPELTVEQQKALNAQLTSIKAQKEKLIQEIADITVTFRQAFFAMVPATLACFAKEASTWVKSPSDCRRVLMALLALNAQSLEQGLINFDRAMMSCFTPDLFDCEIIFKVEEQKRDEASEATVSGLNRYIVSLSDEKIESLEYIDGYGQKFKLSLKALPRGLTILVPLQASRKIIEEAIREHYRRYRLITLAYRVEHEALSILENALLELKDNPNYQLDLQAVNLMTLPLEKALRWDRKKNIVITEPLDFDHHGICLSRDQILQSLTAHQRQILLKRFHLAIEQGNLTMIHHYQAKGLLDYVDPDTGRTPLMAACMKKQLPIIEYLLKNGAAVDRPIQRYENNCLIEKERALDTACSQVHLDPEFRQVVMLLLCYGAQLTLLNAVALNDLELVKKLWSTTTKPASSVSINGYTTLGVAIIHDAHTVLDFLLQQDIALTVGDPRGYDAWQLAADVGNVTALRQLAKFDQAPLLPLKTSRSSFLEDLSVQSITSFFVKPASHQAENQHSTNQESTSKNKALQVAIHRYLELQTREPFAAKRFYAVLRFFLDEMQITLDFETALKLQEFNKAKELLPTAYHQIFAYGRTVWHLCAQYQALILVEELLETRGNKSLYQADEKGYTPLLLACQGGAQEIVSRILNASLPPQDPKVEPALHLAIRFRQIEIVKILLRYKVDKEARWFDRTPLHTAVIERTHDILALLLTDGVAIEAEWAGRRALHQAAEQGDSASVKLLLAHHADVLAKDEQGNLALHFAAAKGHTTITALLIHAMVHHQNNFSSGSKTPAKLAEKSNYPEIKTFFTNLDRCLLSQDSTVDDLKPTIRKDPLYYLETDNFVWLAQWFDTKTLKAGRLVSKRWLQNIREYEVRLLTQSGLLRSENYRKLLGYLQEYINSFHLGGITVASFKVKANHSALFEVTLRQSEREKQYTFTQAQIAYIVAQVNARRGQGEAVMNEEDFNMPKTQQH